jgi:predicted Zn finger-like uncharacterized protein
MIITCEACNASFNLDESRIAPAGSKVRCSKCKKVFVAYPPASAPEEDLHLEKDAVSEGDKADALEFGLDFEMDSHKEVAGDAKEDEVTEELDLSDLELELEMESEREDNEIDEFKELELELEDLDEIKETGAGNVDEGGKFELEVDDLDELGVMSSETQTGEDEPAGNKTEDDFDLGDIELAMDEADTQDEADETELGELEFEDLDEEQIMATEEEMVLAESSDSQEEDTETGDLDLGDFELELDGAQEEKSDEIEDEVESDILLGEETETELTDAEEVLEVDIPIEDENEEELTFEELDDSDIAERSMAIPKEDLFEVEEIALEKDSFSMGEGEKGPETSETDTSQPFTADGQGIKTVSASEPAEKRTGKWLMGILIAVLLLGGTYLVLDYVGVEIPFIPGLTKSTEVLDQKGNLEITLLDYNGNFINNVHAGKLYVVRGMARNDYAEPRGFIQIRGSLYSEARMLVQKKTVYCGNVLSDLDLTNLELDAINKRLQNRVGDNGSNIRIAPGKPLPFMIVFSDLPDVLEEFRLDVESSMKVQ